MVFQYGTEARSNPRLREACEVVRSGALGPIRQIHVYSPNSHPGGSRTPQPVPADLDYDLWLGPAPWRPYSGCAGGGGSWYHVRDYALGFIAGWAAHPLDLMVWAYDITAAGPWEIEGTGRIDTRGSNDAVYDWDVRITLGNGVRMTLRTDGSPGGPPHPHKNLSGNYALFIGERGSIALSYNRVWADPPDLMRTPRTVRLKQSVGQEDDFIRCIRTGGETPVSPIEDAVTSDLVSQLSDTAIRSGRKVRFDPLKRGVIEGGVQQYCARAMREPWRL
jgi:predicted dehydrogenase